METKYVVGEDISIEEFLNFYKKKRNYIFRGCNSKKHKLIPTLYRTEKVEDDYLIETEHKKFLEFLLAKNRKRYNWDQSILRYMAAQHYGCKTKLLDFTTNPFIALCFAIYEWPTNDINDKTDGAIYALDTDSPRIYSVKTLHESGILLREYLTNGLATTHCLIQIRNMPGNNIHDPRERMKKQSGCFVYFSRNTEIDKKAYVKYIIRKEEKHKIHQFLVRNKIFIEDYI